MVDLIINYTYFSEKKDITFLPMDENTFKYVQEVALCYVLSEQNYHPETKHDILDQNGR